MSARLRFAVGLIGALLVVTVHAQPVEIEGAKFEPVVQVAGAALQLNGVGVRTRFVFKVYAAGLYVPQRAKVASELLAQQGPRRMTIVMLRDVDAESFSTALTDGLKSNLTDAQFAAFQPQVDVLKANLLTIGEAKKGDTIFFEFTPPAGTRIVLNGQSKGQAIPGESFYQAVLRVWIGEKPADADLKRGLLGG